MLVGRSQVLVGIFSREAFLRTNGCDFMVSPSRGFATLSAFRSIQLPGFTLNLLKNDRLSIPFDTPASSLYTLALSLARPVSIYLNISQLMA